MRTAGSGLYYSGGSFYNFHIPGVIPDRAVSVPILENNCGFGHVTNLLQNGADSTAVVDDELSIRFHGNLNNTRYSYVLGLFGVTGTTAVNTATVINTAPTVTLSGLSGTFAGQQTITVTFSEAITGLTEGDFSLTNASIVSGTLSAGAGSSYTFDIVANAAGAVSVSLPATVVESAVLLGNAASNTLSATADFTPPTVVLSGLPSVMYNTPKTITATFSEDVTGFTSADVATTGVTTLSNFTIVNATTYTFDVLGSGAAVTLAINAGVADDLAGNGNLASSMVSATGGGVATPIAAAFSVAPAIATSAPHTAFFTNASTPTTGESITSWSWDFGDGSTSTAKNPVHNYLSTGMFNVTMEACDAVGCDTATGTVTVAASLGSLGVTLAGFDGAILGPQTVTITFDDQLDPSVFGGLTLDDFTTTNLTLSSLVQTSSGPAITDPDVYTLTATPDAAGPVSLSLPASKTGNHASANNTASNILSGNNNSAPVADAGPDQVVPSGAVVTLDASGSSDPDSPTLTYSWTAPSGITLSDATASNPTFTAPALAAGDPDMVLAISVDVSDGTDVAQDSVQITVRGGVTVTLSGLPAEISGPGDHTVSIAFSRAMTGFTEADITVIGGTVSSLSGSGAAYTAVIAASGGGDLSVSIPASIATDANSIENAASNVVVAVNMLGATTSKEIAHFMQTRANALLSNQPDLAGLLRGGAGGLHADVTRDGGVLSFDSGYDAPVWTRLTANWTTDTGAESRYIFGAIGAHSKLSENFLLGGMLQFDLLDEVNGAATTRGTGWLVGPYFTAKHSSQQLYFEGSLLYGQTRNTVSPLGTYTDNFSTERWLATLGVSGQIEQENLTLIPFLDAKYTRDAQVAYLDGLGNPIAAQTIDLAQISAGLDFGLELNVSTTLNGGISGIWSHSSGSVLEPGYEGGRARLELGIEHRFSACNALEVSGFYDGIGAANYESFGAAFKWKTCF